MNDVALRANEVLRNDVGLRPTMLRFASWRQSRRFIEAVRLLLHIREANASFLLAIRPKVFYNVFDASVK